MLAAAATAAVLLATAGSTATAASSQTGKESVVFFYQRIDSSDTPTFEGARAVVTADQADDAQAVQAIHAAGAQAIKYTNIFWYPDNGTYQGIDIASHMDWAFCASRNRPLVGRTVAGVKWYYLDANEKAARGAVMAYFAHLKALGYDGVFFDRGSAALRGPKSGIAWKASTCTGSRVHRRNRRFADVYADVMRSAHNRFGFTEILNYAHPYTSTKLRPDPDDRDCRTGHLRRCTFKRDLWKSIADVVDESRGGDRSGSGFLHDYRIGLAAEQHAPRGRPARVIREVKVTKNDRGTVFYRWARARLFRVLMFVNTGNDRCGGRGDCFRFGTYPELTRVSLGRPVDRRPISLRCSRGSRTACLWVRRYQGGMTVVNVATRAKVLRRLRLRVSSCRHVKDVYRSSASDAVTLAGNRCVGRISYRMAGRSGRVFLYSRSRW